MSLEIERKFLVTATQEELELDRFPHENIRQGYMVIANNGSEARLRDRGGDHTMTVKSEGGISRGEWEVKITRDQFYELWPSTEGKRLEKDRFVIPLGEEDKPIAELDVYAGNLVGLMTVEVEFDSELIANNFFPPDWFGVEVTGDFYYKNQQLATKGMPPEPRIW